MWQFRAAIWRVGIAGRSSIDIDRPRLHRGKYRDFCSERVERKASRGTFSVINKRSQAEKWERFLVSARKTTSSAWSSCVYRNRLASWMGCTARHNDNQTEPITYRSRVCLLRLFGTKNSVESKFIKSYASQVKFKIKLVATSAASFSVVKLNFVFPFCLSPTLWNTITQNILFKG